MPRMVKMPTVRKGLRRFELEPSIRGPRSVFNLSHGHKTTFDAGFLIPVLVKEVLPGDTWALSMSGFARLTSQALQKPIMDNLYCDSFFFYVPMRLLWNNAVKFFGEQVNPGDSISYVLPAVTVPFTPVQGSLHDYFGVFTATGSAIIQTPNAINALPYRAYYLIYNQWFRDQNLINSASVPVASDGPDTYGGGTLPLKRAKRPDYFTASLPFLQKGTAASAAVSPVAGIPTFKTSGGSNVLNLVAPGTDLGNVTGDYTSGTPAAAAMEWVDPKLTVLINDLRQAVMIQEFLERDARGGTRYPELVEMHFGVRNPDARVQRSEYLGGGSTPIIVNPVAQTSASGLTGGSAALGSLAGSGSVFLRNHGFHKSFSEHGYIVGIVNVRADVTYQQGIEKLWTRSTRFDFYWREFAHLGEQAVLNKEIYFQATTALNASDNAVFGYQPRYEDYRFAFSRISGKFRSQDGTPLDNWHLSQEFGSLPTLGQTFIEDDTETVLDRVVAVATEPDILADFWFDIKAARPIPVYGVPAFGRRF